MSDDSAMASSHDPAQEVMMSEGEWKGLIDLLRAAADEEPERAVEGVDGSAAYFMTNYADYIEERRKERDCQ